MDSQKKRVTMKLKHPNPLFEEWLIEWRDKAKEKDSKIQHCYAKALQSLKKYPLPLEKGRDCKILNGFGDRLCQMLDERLDEYNSGKNNESDPDKTIDYAVENVKITTKAKHKLNNDVPKEKSPQNTKRNRKEYVPIYRSGPYAILIALYENGTSTKQEIIEKAQHLCDKPFTKPDPGTYYTSWSSMRTLLDKELVTKKGNPAKFSLTASGTDLAIKLYENNVAYVAENRTIAENVDNQILQNRIDNIQGENEIMCSDDNFEDLTRVSQSSSKSVASQSSNFSNKSEKIVTNFETVFFEPNTFEVLLVVDKQETAGSKEKLQNDPILLELTRLGVRHDVMHLKVGDYVWICRSRTIPNVELVLSYIIERKRMDDFGSSIKDGRYHDQKFRLKQCGIQNIIYLIESYGDNTHTGLPLTTLQQAASNTLIQDGFTVKFTDGVRGTAQYLNCMTKILKENYEPKTIMSCPKINLEKSTINDDLIPLMHFQEFNQSGAKYKSFTASEMFMKQLVQLKGLSIDKAMVIIDRFPTVKLFKRACDEDVEETEKIVANIQFGKKRKIGPAISSTICRFYNSKDFP